MNSNPQQHQQHGNPPQHPQHQAGSPQGQHAQHQAPMGRPTQVPNYDPVQPPVPEGPNRLLIGIIGLALLVAGFGLVRKFVIKPEPASAQPVVVAPSPWQEQQQMMRDAMDMAREAQQMNREHQAQMRRAMEMEYGEEYPDEDW
jgi:hypothetical protein